jgi:hypothetical protein
MVINRTRSAATIVLAIALLAQPAPASAAPEPDGEGRAPASAAAPLEGYIYNRDSWGAGYGIGIGVISDFDGSYTYGRYDRVLPSKQRTDRAWGWPRAQGFYIGPGWCANLAEYKAGKWRVVGTKYSGIHYLPKVAGEQIARYMIDPFPC